MPGLNRRDFARLGGAALALTAVGCASGSGVARAAGTTPTISLTLDQRLAPIAQELRPSARRMLEMGMPPLTEEVLRSLPPNTGAPKPQFLADIPVEERTLAPQGTLPGVRVFVVNSDPAKRQPAILHTHGGGFILGTVEGELRNLQDTAKALDCTIVSVAYRLSPGARYDAATEDTYAGLKWLHDNAEQLGVDRGKIALMGESAGGGHAAMLAIKARDRGEVPVLFQSLVYPMLDDRTGSSRQMPSHVATVGWSAAENRLGWKSFLGMEPGGAAVPIAAVPARLDRLEGLAPAWIGVGGVDLFASEDMEYARRLTLAGVPTELLVIPGAYHGFDRAAEDTTLAQRFTQAKLDALRRAFAAD